MFYSPRYSDFPEQEHETNNSNLEFPLKLKALSHKRKSVKSSSLIIRYITRIHPVSRFYAKHVVDLNVLDHSVHVCAKST
jgi:hypothetical protein